LKADTLMFIDSSNQLQCKFYYFETRMYIIHVFLKQMQHNIVKWKTFVGHGHGAVLLGVQ